jgi:hypothetical protein
MVGMRILAFVLLSLAACRVRGEFTCETDAECRGRGAVGRCDLSNGFCTFNDASCSSGFRYASTAGEDLADTCTPAQDAGMSADASTFDTSTCPATYTGALAGFDHAKYVVLAAAQNGASFAAQVQRCEGVATHAVIVDSSAKAAALTTYIGTGRHWVGLVQRKTATSVGGDWLLFTGEPVDASLWAGSQMQPDDANSNESDHSEQAGAFGPQGLYDQAASSSLPIVCECDGRQSSDEVLAILEGGP